MRTGGFTPTPPRLYRLPALQSAFVRTSGFSKKLKASLLTSSSFNPPWCGQVISPLVMRRGSLHPCFNPPWCGQVVSASRRSHRRFLLYFNPPSCGQVVSASMTPETMILNEVSIRLRADKWFQHERARLPVAMRVSICLRADKWFQHETSHNDHATVKFQSAFVRTSGFSQTRAGPVEGHWFQSAFVRTSDFSISIAFSATAKCFNPPACGQVGSMQDEDSWLINRHEK